MQIKSIILGLTLTVTAFVSAAPFCHHHGHCDAPYDVYPDEHHDDHHDVHFDGPYGYPYDEGFFARHHGHHHFHHIPFLTHHIPYDGIVRDIAGVKGVVEAIEGF